MRSELRGEIGGLDVKIDALTEYQAEMSGKLDVVVRQSHTHTAA